MKKERNTFFSNYNAQTQAFIPEYPQNMNPQMMMPNSNFNAYGMTSMSSNNSYSNDFDNRLSKIERQINRLDNRLTKLESMASNNTPTNIEENNFSNNMYML